jgi:hypothetical protein
MGLARPGWSGYVAGGRLSWARVLAPLALMFAIAVDSQII